MRYSKYKQAYINLKQFMEGGKSFEKYEGRFEWTDLIKNLKLFHNRVKGYYIKKYCKDISTLVDVGSGRGSDAKYWIECGVKYAVGIEPSSDSIKRAVINYNKLKKEFHDKKITRITFLNGSGEKRWDDGTASLRKEDKERFIRVFKDIKADVVNLFWTIHYMMDTKEDFKTLIYNLNHTVRHHGGIIIILCMDGKKIDKLLKEHNGVYEIKKDDKLVFKLTAKYDYHKSDLDQFGNKITVNLASTYGLEKGIDENLVFIDELINSFKKEDYTLIENTDFLDVNIPERDKLHEYEKPVSDLYRAIILKKA